MLLLYKITQSRTSIRDRPPPILVFESKITPAITKWAFLGMENTRGVLRIKKPPGQAVFLIRLLGEDAMQASSTSNPSVNGFAPVEVQFTLLELNL